MEIFKQTIFLAWEPKREYDWTAMSEIFCLIVIRGECKQFAKEKQYQFNVYITKLLVRLEIAHEIWFQLLTSAA